MSHLACSENKEHPKNRSQLEKFEAARLLFPDVTASLANSGGIFLGNDFHFDLIRAGIGLYGSVEFNTGDAQLQNVLSLHVPILQIRNVKKGETVGYGCDFIAHRDSQVAVIGIGYADGIFRHLGDLEDKPASANVALEGQILPLIGRISMDLTTIDVTDFEGTLEKGKMVELIGDNIKLADVAQRANSISYEILTRLGTRFKRYYKQSDKP
jgi:alanine racemase